MEIEIQPSKEVIDIWIKKYVPEKDLFFLCEKDLEILSENLNDVLVIPKDEFFLHASYKQIQLVNSYEYWNISKDVDFVLVALPYWITHLNQKLKNKLFQLQVKVGRGLIIPLSFFPDIELIPKEHIVLENEVNYVVLQNNMWHSLPYSSKEQALKSFALLWDKWNCKQAPENTPEHLLKYANTFPVEAGSNCLSATLYSVLVTQDWIINEWVHPKTFTHGLKRCSYSIITDQIIEGDVVTWVNEEGIVQHASYHIGNNLFFNKTGQTIFNPWKIVHWDELEAEWDKYNIKIYRKQ